MVNGELVLKKMLLCFSFLEKTILFAIPMHVSANLCNKEHLTNVD